MADESFSWVFELVDKITKPARAMKSAMGALEKVAWKAFDALGDRGKVGVVGALQRMANLQPQVAAGFQKLGGGLSRMGSVAMTAFGGMALGAGAAVGGLAVVGSKFAYDSLTFKENTLTAFEAIIGSKTGADALYNKAVKLAADTPFETKDVVSSSLQLLAGGFKDKEIMPLLGNIGDIGIVKGKEGLESVIRALTQIKAKGKLSGEEMMQLAEAGVSQKLVYESLGKTLGKTRAQLDKMQQAGKIDDVTATKAIQEAIINGVSGGKAGSQMDKLSKTASGRMSTLQSRPFELVTAANFKEGPFGSFIENLAAALDPKSPTGQRIVGMIELIGNTFNKIFGPATTDVAGLGGSLDKLLDVFEPLLKLGMTFITGVADGFKAFLPIFSASMGQLSQDPEGINRLTRGLELLGKVWGFLAGAVALGAVHILATPLAIVSGFQWMIDKVRSFMLELELTWDRFRNFGANIVDGLWTGLQEAWARFIPNFTGLWDQLPAAVRNTLDMHSPSRVFAALGANTAAGFVAGFDSGMVNDAVIAGVAAPNAPIASKFSAADGMGGRTVSVGNISVQLGNVDPAEAEQVGQRIGKSILAELLAGLDGISLEAGTT